MKLKTIKEAKTKKIMNIIQLNDHIKSLTYFMPAKFDTSDANERAFVGSVIGRNTIQRLPAVFLFAGASPRLPLV